MSRFIKAWLSLLFYLFLLTSYALGEDDTTLELPITTQVKKAYLTDNTLINRFNFERSRGWVIPELENGIADGSIALIYKADDKDISSQEASSPSQQPKQEEAQLFLESILSELGYLEGVFSLINFKENSKTAELSLKYTRLYSKALSSSRKDAPIFRERIDLISPKSLLGYTFLTFRLGYREEDISYIFSPAINKLRRITGANRGDAILKSTLALDDIFTYSGSGLGIEITSITEHEYLIPFLEEPIPIIRDATSTNCRSLSINSEEKHSEGVKSWNFESQRFSAALPSLPTQAFWQLRKLLKLELEPRDPFALYGRQLLYIDSSSKLPVFKIVNDISGRALKRVYSLLATTLASPEKKGEKESKFANLYPIATIIDDLQKRESSILNITQLKSCSKVKDDFSLAIFDPNTLSTQKKRDSPSPTSSTQPMETVDE
jgi:hypothetical protein